ncbi:MAG: hypothetical protein PHD83_00770 [Caldisericia bacterium]|nr:hypothetical protein [Caldisericia bacterium]
MTENEKEKLEKANNYFAVECFNQIWTILDKPDKEAQELETILHLAHTSFWHWSQNPKAQPSNIAIGYWMLSRVYAVAKNTTQSLLYAQKCLEHNQTNKLNAFSFGYAYEALARAYYLIQHQEKMEECLQKGYEYVEKVQDAEEKQFLTADLNELKGS